MERYYGIFLNYFFQKAFTNCYISKVNDLKKIEKKGRFI